MCEKHFVSGRVAKSWEKFNIDWVPTSVEEIIKTWGRNKLRGRGSVAELVKKAVSKESGICLMMLGRWLDLTLMYKGWLLGFL